MAAKKYKVGLEIEAWCTKCKVDRLHVIETLKSDGNINRVLCRTCESIHLFRRPKGEGGTGTTTRRKKKPDHVVSEAEQASAKAYVIDIEVAVGDVLQHAKFGYGKVKTLKPGGKMEVAFDEGVKVLVCKDQGSLLLKRGRAAAQARAAAAMASASKEKEEVEAKDDGDEATEEEES